ncbi:uncharacterized protein ACBT57_013052 [Dama dama]
METSRSPRSVPLGAPGGFSHFLLRSVYRDSSCWLKHEGNPASHRSHVKFEHCTCLTRRPPGSIILQLNTQQKRRRTPSGGLSFSESLWATRLPVHRPMSFVHIKGPEHSLSPFWRLTLPSTDNIRLISPY